MNRIILIGNGFDLAHNLPTKYENFIDDFWSNKVKAIKEEGSYINFQDGYTVARNNPISVYKDEDIVIELHNPKSIKANNTSSIPKAIQSFFDREKIKIDMQFKNKFLRRIMTAYKDKKWVDIEEEYNVALKNCFNNKDEIDKLNHDFIMIKIALIEYLNKVVTINNVEKKEKIEESIYSEFNLQDFIEKGRDTIIDEEYEKLFQLKESARKQTTKNLSYRTSTLSVYFHHPSFEFKLPKVKADFKKLIMDEKNVSNFFNLFPRQILFLNFNYTEAENEYIGYQLRVPKESFGYIEIDIEKEIIHIHGNLNSGKNPIIFGYGDEIGKDYLEIENLNDNRFLENVKSIKYLETNNYKRLLNFIDSDKYQIFIMGHSCGISDRTLLSTLFEHDNCVSIKIFYHKKEDGTDNFSDVVRNISRNFSNKAVMREKVVNKMDSESLS